MKNLTYALLAAIILLTSCSKEEPLEINTNNKSNQAEIQAIPPIYWLAALVIVNAGDVFKGHYYHRTKYNSDGSIQSVEHGCEGTIGTCEKPSIIHVDGEDILLDLNYSEPQTYEVNHSIPNGLIIKTTNNELVYAIDSEMYPEQAELYFYNDVITFSKDFIIDNPRALEALGLPTDEPVVQPKGDYQVYQNENFRFVYIKK